MAGRTIADFVKAKVAGWQADVIHSITEIVQRAAPGVTAVIKWGQPVFEHGGPLAYIRSARNHVTFGFWRGAEIDDPRRLLEGAGARMKHMKLTKPGDLKPAALMAMVKHAVRLNRQKGSPTARA
jgi:hypothetical protein